MRSYTATLDGMGAVGDHLVAASDVTLDWTPEGVTLRGKGAVDGLTIDAPGFVEPEPDRPCQYVQEVRLDGSRLDRSWVGATELGGGRHLEIVLGDRPSPWGTTTPDVVPFHVNTTSVL